MPCASFSIMKMLMKIVGLAMLFGGSIVAAVAIDRRRRLPAPSPVDRMAVPPDVVIVEAEIIGVV